MARCTAPTFRNQTESGRTNCLAYGGKNYNFSPSYPSYPTYFKSSKNSTSQGRISGQGKTRANWSLSVSSVLYASTEIRTLAPVIKNVAALFLSKASDISMK
ncbi:MAG: hypothetical protein ACJAYY_001207 [Paraglaciecola sp.]|jgi:hypothetical protein|uniref:hypothetical protein n=1 Tax=Polaribacter sp. TaxID=1920175 RepID=UPI003AEE879D